jgi:hypothetical protein
MPQTNLHPIRVYLVRVLKAGKFKIRRSFLLRSFLLVGTLLSAKAAKGITWQDRAS